MSDQQTNPLDFAPGVLISSFMEVDGYMAIPGPVREYAILIKRAGDDYWDVLVVGNTTGELRAPFRTSWQLSPEVLASYDVRIEELK